MPALILFIVNILLVEGAMYNSNLKLVEEALYITNKYYKPHIATIVVWDDDILEEENYFLNKFPGTVVITRFYDNYTNHFSITNHVMKGFGYAQSVFFATNIDNYEKFVAVINQRHRFPIKLVLICKETINDDKKLSEFNQIAWMNNIADFIVISKDFRNKITISTYFPYKDDICGNFIPVKLKNDDNLFPKKFNNFNKCPIRTSAIAFPKLLHFHFENGILTELGGHDGATLTEIINAINASLQFIEGSDKSGLGTYTNEKASGSLSDLVHNKADIIIPAGVLTYGRYSVTQTSHMYHYSGVYWIGPKRREIYTYIKILIPFFNIITPIICLAFVVFVVAAKLINRWSLSRYYRRSNICFNTFSLLVGQTAHYVTIVSLLNNLFLLWIWFSFIIRIIYQSYLVDFLQVPFLEPAFESIEEAVKIVDGYGGTLILSEFFKNTSLENGFIIFPLSDYYTSVEQITDGKRFLLAADSFVIQQFRNSVQILPDQITSTWSCFFMRPGWPVAPTIDSIIVRLIEMGFMERRLRMDSPFQSIDRQNDRYVQALNMSMLNACFIIMLVMWMICLAVLLLEIINYKLKIFRSKQVCLID